MKCVCDRRLGPIDVTENSVFIEDEAIVGVHFARGSRQPHQKRVRESRTGGSRVLLLDDGDSNQLD